MSRLVAAVFAVVTALAQKESGITTINTPIPTTSTASATGSASTHPSTITSGPIAATTSDPLLGLAESLLSEYKSTSLRPIPSEIVLDSSTFTVSSGFILTPPPTTSPTPASTTELRATLSHSSLASTPTNVASSPKGDMEAAIVIGVAVGGLALAVILFVALGAHRRKRKTGTYLKRRPTTRSTNKDAEMWQALKHDGTAMTSPATPGPFKDEWSDGCSSTRNQVYLSGPSVRKQLPSPSTPLSSAQLPLRRPDPTFSPTGSEEANVTDPLDAERTGLSPHHELDGRPLPPLPIESTLSPQELQGDAVFPSELSPYGRNSSKIEEETAAHLDRQLQLHRPLSWTPLMRPQRSSTPSTPKRQHSGALDAVSPLALMGFGGGNRKDLPLRPFSHQPQSTKSLPEPELTSAQNGSPSPELSRQASGHAPELNTTRLQRSVAFEQVQQRALARHPSQLTLSSFPSGQTIRLVNPSESPPEPMSKPPSGPLLSQARYEPPPPKKARRASQVWGLNRARSGQHSVEDDGEPRDSRRASGPMLLPTRYEPPTPSASNNSRRPCELESPEFTSTHESAKASDTNRNKAELSSPVGNLSHPTDKNNQATALRATVPIVESTKSVDPENHTQSQIEPQRASPNQFAAPSNPDFFEQQKMQTNRTRNVDRKPVSSTASFESMEIRAYQASLPPWTQPYAPTLHAIPDGLNAPSMDATPQPRGLGPSRAYSARNVHYPSWSEISEFDFTGDGSNPVRFLRPQRSFGQLVSSKVREIEERVELLGSLPAGYVSGSLHSGSRPGTPRSANNSHGHAI
ncbi:hypothetical protein Tdes44962_MAKER03078 [Teratosphaeria destructans]|uniref:Uncharacterized protein n=1 Tax=Teratosphaeria destructans TaxID=418781 RepID=A0A9W7W1Q7_9PEZI|nr:hypothetical protein Tdes44962_MAKER03078 [Teratosphaeria destructans]